MKYKEISEDSINLLMDVFYEKIRQDKNGLGDIFNDKIGTSEKEWEAHKAKIANFWQGVLLETGDYSGQPLKAHIDLPPFKREFFDIWLKLFEESLKEVYVSQTCIKTILSSAQSIAARFIHMLYEIGHKH